MLNSSVTLNGSVTWLNAGLRGQLTTRKPILYTLTLDHRGGKALGLTANTKTLDTNLYSPPCNITIDCLFSNKLQF